MCGESSKCHLVWLESQATKRAALILTFPNFTPFPEKSPTPSSLMLSVCICGTCHQASFSGNLAT